MPGGRSRLSRKHCFSAWVVAVVDHPSRRVRRFHCPPPPLAIVAEEPATLSVIRPLVLVVAPVPETSCLLVFVFGPLLGPRRRRLRRGESIHDVCHCIHVVPDRRQVTQSACSFAPLARLRWIGQGHARSTAHSWMPLLQASSRKLECGGPNLLEKSARARGQPTRRISQRRFHTRIRSHRDSPKAASTEVLISPTRPRYIIAALGSSSSIQRGVPSQAQLCASGP